MKFNIDELNEKVIAMEESIYEMENLQLDMVNQLKDMEATNLELQAKNE